MYTVNSVLYRVYCTSNCNYVLRLAEDSCIVHSSVCTVYGTINIQMAPSLFHSGELISSSCQQTLFIDRQHFQAIVTLHSCSYSFIDTCNTSMKGCQYLLPTTSRQYFYEGLPSTCYLQHLGNTCPSICLYSSETYAFFSTALSIHL